MPEITATDRCPECGYHLRETILDIPHCTACGWAAHQTGGVTTDA